MPPLEWIEERVSGMQEVMERRTDRSALQLRALLGKIELEQTKGEIGQPYYVARISLDTLAPLATPPGQDGTAWVASCKSLYLDPEGEPTLWPWSAAHFHKVMRHPDFSDFEPVDAA